MKHSPEVEARRIASIKKALGGKPATDAQRIARADGLRRAWAEGRVTYKKNPEARAKTAKKLTGRKRTPGLMERLRISNTGKKRTKEYCAKLSEIVRAGKAAGKYKIAPEVEAERARKIVESHTGVAMPAGTVVAKGVGHFRAKWFRVRTPSGYEIEGKCMNEIVRTHSNLFLPEDIAFKGHQCNAANGLRKLFHVNGKSCSWKGWVGIASWEDEDMIARTVAHSTEENAKADQVSL